jgi:hypothetical protein
MEGELNIGCEIVGCELYFEIEMKQKIIQTQRMQSGECAQKAKLVTALHVMKLNQDLAVRRLQASKMWIHAVCGYLLL